MLCFCRSQTKVMMLLSTWFIGGCWFAEISNVKINVWQFWKCKHLISWMRYHAFCLWWFVWNLSWGAIFHCLQELRILVHVVYVTLVKLEQWNLLKIFYTKDGGEATSFAIRKLVIEKDRGFRLSFCYWSRL